MITYPIIRIAQGYSPPYANICENSSICENPGIDTWLLIMKLTALKFRIEFVNVDPPDLLQTIQNETADITGSTAPLTREDYFKLQPTNTVLNDKALLMVKSVKMHSQSLLFSMCDWPVWLMVLFCFGLVLIFKFLAVKLNRKSNSRNLLASDLPLAAWGLTFTAIFYTSTSFLAIIFSQTTHSPPPFKTFASFARKLASGECQLYVNHSFSEDVVDLMPKSRNLSWFLNIFHKHPLKSMPDERSLLLKVLNGSNCNVGVIYKSERPLYETMSCNVQFLDFDEFPNTPYVYYYRRNFSFADRLLSLEASDDYYQISIEQYAKERFIKQKMYEHNEYLKSTCVSGNKRNTAASVVEPLDLWQLMDIFFMLIVGILLSLLLHFTSFTETWDRLSDLFY